jgi:DNA polymerase III epsilon subunit-like protein
VEVAVVLLDRACRVEREFSTLLDPSGPVGPTHIHGIAVGDVGGAPGFTEIASHLVGLLRGRVLVGHHVNCDRAFLAGEYARLGVDFPDVPTLCTMQLAPDYLPLTDGPSLRACCEEAGLPRFEAHTALGDARAAAALFGHYAGSHRVRPPKWSRALREAAVLPWPRMAPGPVPPMVNRNDVRVMEGNAGSARIVPATSDRRA